MSTIEIERKFLCKVDSALFQSPSVEILQAYICVGKGEEVRIRRESHSPTKHLYTLTCKSGSGLQRGEYEIDIGKDQFDVLFNANNGRIIRKNRHTVKVSSTKIYVDRFLDAHIGLVIAEVEFESVTDATKFVPPSWFGVEVTDDASYKNSALASKSSGTAVQPAKSSAIKLGYKLLTLNAKAPTKGSKEAAGFDIYSTVDAKIAPGNRVAVDTGLVVAIPKGYYGRVAPRSGLAVNKGIDVCAGVIDSDYRGEVKVVLANNLHNAEPFVLLESGTRVAQLILEKYADDVELVPMDTVDETQRGTGGFGSTGL